MRYWQACTSFLRELRRDFIHTGAVAPSSRFLAKALVSRLRQPRAPARILEVGAGTGAITAEILRYLRPDDQLDLVEINPHFVGVLTRRFQADWHFRRFRTQMSLIHSAVEQVPGDAAYDYIVSCLPFNNFPPHQVRKIFQVYERLLKPGGTLSFYEYVLVRQLKSPFVGRRERRRLFRVGRIVSTYVDDHQFSRQQVFMNLPPATVRHLRFKPLVRTQG